MTRLATLLLLAATTTAQFAGDAAAGGTATKPNPPRQTNWMGQATKPASTNATKPKRKRWKRRGHVRDAGRARNTNGGGARGSRGLAR